MKPDNRDESEADTQRNKHTERITHTHTRTKSLRDKKQRGDSKVGPDVTAKGWSGRWGDILHKK